MDEIQSVRPLSVWIPSEYGGRGGHVWEALSMLEESSYQSLPLSLTFGINGALFLQPVSKYGTEEAKAEVLSDFTQNGRLGGLMITEPDYGTDALSMQTAFQEVSDGYHINGTKHWGGLTGMANYWLVTARKSEDKGLGRDIHFFIADMSKAEQKIVVDEYYPSLGLFMIPYGRNLVDIKVPKHNRLESSSTGIRMLLDTLHRSRAQFPGMAMGFLRRLFDDAVQHCMSRNVGGQSLFNYDQVKRRLSTMQAYSTVCSAMCAFTSRNAKIEKSLAGDDVSSNSIKAVVTDCMQNAAQSALQLTGAVGYRLDARAGRATIDSRPFQIFEGANDILYQQVMESVAKIMRRKKEKNLFRFLSGYDLTSRAVGRFERILSFDIDGTQSQRKLVELGRGVARIISMGFVKDLGDRGFRSDLIANCLATLQMEVESIVARLDQLADCVVSTDNRESAAWQDYRS